MKYLKKIDKIGWIITFAVFFILVTMGMISYNKHGNPWGIKNNWEDEDFSFTTTYLWKESPYSGWEMTDIFHKDYKVEVRDSTIYYYVRVNDTIDRIFEWKIVNWEEPTMVVETSGDGAIRVIDREEIDEANLEKRGLFYVYDIQDSSRMIISFGKIQEINEGYNLVNNDSTVMRVMLPYEHTMVDYTNLLPDSLYLKR